jgi:hypothetical protein
VSGEGRAYEVRLRRKAAHAGLDLHRREHWGPWVLSDPSRPTDPFLVVSEDLEVVEQFLLRSRGEY